MATREAQIAEAKARLEILKKKGLMDEVLQDFDKGLIHYSLRVCSPLYCSLSGNEKGAGALFWINQDSTDSRIKEAVETFEDEHNALVYHATYENVRDMGEMLDLFFVSDYEEEWAMDREELEEGRPFVWVSNLDDSSCSEFGAILYEASGGGLIRVA